MQNDKSLSKYLSLILRHKPSTIGLKLDESGWAEVAFLLSKVNDLSMDRLEKIVREDEKQRYSFNQDKTKIRANQGHSISVDLQLKPEKPPRVLYHGTPASNEIAIMGDGLRKMQRQHVHLSADFETAKTVAARRKDKSVIFRVLALDMFVEGHEFFCSENGVWLTDFVPAAFIEIVGYVKRVEPNETRRTEFNMRKGESV